MSHSDKSFLNNLIIVIAALVVFMILAVVLANSLPTGTEDKNADPMVQAAIAERIAPVGSVNTSTVKAAPAAGGAADAKGTYQSACFACHGTGAAGAPKFGDKGAWKARIAQGLDTLFDHALHGFKGMPAKGGRSDLSDDAVKAVVKYMVKNSK
ncbi:MAG: c-type cytochrome [Gammaproteobacteria bacterium]